MKRESFFMFEKDRENNSVHIIDLFEEYNSSKKPLMTVTNNAENVIEEIREKCSWFNDDTKILSTDTNGEMARIIPKWENGKCINVSFITPDYNNSSD